MKNYALCPISDQKINERVARINGAFTVMLLIFSALSQSIYPVIFLAIDFLLRAFNYIRYSPVAISSRGIVMYLSLSDKFINAGPKIFAARIGLVLCSLIIVAYALNAYTPAFVLGGILGLFSFLEAAFGLCVACEIYPFVYRLLYKVKYQGI
jgi:hypothetical protein